jgi:hypothetical protein
MQEIKDELVRIDSKLEVISNSIHNIDKVNSENTVVLKEHIKRTELNETRIKSLEYWIIGLLTSGVFVALANALKQ